MNENGKPIPVYMFVIWHRVDIRVRRTADRRLQ